MAWRPHNALIKAVFNNSIPGKITGWLELCPGDDKTMKVTIDLDGDFNKSVKSNIIEIEHHSPIGSYPLEYFLPHQNGWAGTFCVEPHPLFEWYNNENGRVLFEFYPHEVNIQLGEKNCVSTPD